MKSKGFPQIPQDIMEEYNGCSVPDYTRYHSDSLKQIKLINGDILMIIIEFG